MGVYIKDMEKPEACLACDFCNPFTEKPYCRRLMKVTPKTTTLPDCPLIKVPPHGRLGDLDKLEQMFVDIDNAPYSGFDGTEPFYTAEDAAQIIRLAPTVIPAEEGERWTAHD